MMILIVMIPLLVEVQVVHVRNMDVLNTHHQILVSVMICANSLVIVATTTLLFVPVKGVLIQILPTITLTLQLMMVHVIIVHQLQMLGPIRV